MDKVRDLAKKELLRLREQDRVETAQRKKRIDEYNRERVMAKLAAEKRRQDHINAQRAMLQHQRWEARERAAREKHRIVEAFEQMRTTGKLVLPKGMDLDMPAGDELLPDLPGSARGGGGGGGGGSGGGKARGTSPSRPATASGGRAGAGGSGKPRSGAGARRPGSAGPRRNREGLASEPAQAESGGASGKAELTDYNAEDEEPERPKSAMNINPGGQPQPERIHASKSAAALPQGISTATATENKPTNRKHRAKRSHPRGTKSHRPARQARPSRPASRKERLARLEAMKQGVESTRRAQNEFLLRVLEEEQQREHRRELRLRKAESREDRGRLSRMFQVERCRASQKIVALTEEHARNIGDKMARLNRAMAAIGAEEGQRGGGAAAATASSPTSAAVSAGGHS